MMSQYLIDLRNQKLGIKPPIEKKKPAPIAKVSKTRADLNKVYAAKRKQFLKKKTACEAGLSECTGKATDLHHGRGRGKYLLDETTYKALCRNCHTTIEKDPTLAKSLGLSFSRLSIVDDVNGKKVTIIQNAKKAK